MREWRWWRWRLPTKGVGRGITDYRLQCPRLLGHALDGARCDCDTCRRLRPSSRLICIHIFPLLHFLSRQASAAAHRHLLLPSHLRMNIRRANGRHSSSPCFPCHETPTLKPVGHAMHLCLFNDSRRILLISPTPDSLEELAHIHLLRLHLHHPRMLLHAPRRRSSGRLFLQTVTIVSTLPRIPRTLV